MKKPLRLAVASDLHVGTGARAKDLSPSPSTHQIESNYRSTFIKFLRENTIRADYLLCPGDVSNKAQPDEFVLASEFLLEIAEALGVAEERIAFVPGNHDVNWTSFSQYPDDKTGLGAAQRYVPLTRTSQVLSRCISKSSTSLVDEPYLGFWEDEHAVLFAHNSSWNDNPDTKPHHGSISTKSLEELDRLLSARPPANGQLRVFLVHHHPVQYSDPAPDSPDFSLMVNSDALLKMLGRHEIDLLVHGHKHKPHFNTYATTPYPPLAILGSGSLSALISTRWSGIVANQFHVIAVDGRTRSGRICGTVESWSYLFSNGWQKSRIHHGIEHRRPFGKHDTISELRSLVSPIINARRGPKAYCSWHEIVAECSDLKYLPAETILQVLRDIEKHFDFRTHGDTPEDIVLLFN